MSLDGASGPNKPALRPARNVAAIGGNAELVQRLQKLGIALATAVRSTVRDPALAEGLVGRLRSLWLEHDDVFEWQPTEIRVEGRVVLAASAQSGRFILDAYRAGLRALAIRKQCTLADVMRLAQQLGALEAMDIEPAQFSDWLWRGGALGFDVAQAETAEEIGQSLLDPIDGSAFWAKRSQHAVEQWNERALSAAAALSAQALSERFLLPTRRLQERVVRGELSLTREDATALRTAADDPQAFARCEVGLLVQYAALRRTLSGAEVSLRLATFVEGTAQPDARMLGLFAALDGKDTLLDRVILGEALGRRLRAHPFAAPALLGLADQADATLLKGMFSVLLSGEGSDVEHSLPILILLLDHWGAERFFRHIDQVLLSPALAAALLSHACNAQADTDVLVAVLTRLPVPAALQALIACPKLLDHAQVLYENLIVTHPQSSGPLLEGLVQSGPAVARCVGAAMLTRLAVGFRDDALKPCLVALTRAGLGEQFVLPLWEARRATSSARLCALAAIAGDSDLLAIAQTRRTSGISGAMSEPNEIREALEALHWNQGK